MDKGESTWKEQFEELMNSDYFNYDVGYRNQIKDFIQTEIQKAYKAGQENGFKRAKENFRQLIEEIPNELPLNELASSDPMPYILKMKQQLRDKWLIPGKT